MKGILWRVGNGKTIRIIKDNWIQSTTTIKSVVHLPENLKVRSLIDEVAGRWNEDIVRSYFSEDDAEKILQIHYAILHVRTFHLGLTPNQEYILSNQHTHSQDWKAFITF